MRGILKAPLFLGGVALCFAVTACQYDLPFVDQRDLGGNLREYIAEVRRINADGGSKAIRGVCASACTIFLGVKKVCVDPAAELWFHAAHMPSDNRPDPLGSLEMLSYYPPHVREWVVRTHALESVDFGDAKKLTGEQLILMGVPPCGPASTSVSVQDTNAKAD